jgi:hypothetical protein
MATGAPGSVAAPAAPAAPAVKALACPSCGGTITLRAAGFTVTVACQYCGSILDVANPDVRLIKEFHEAAAQLEIPLGTRGNLRGIDWEVVGYVRRSEGGAYPWEEYLLFNPYAGYRWLITNGRGWSFGEMLTRSPYWEGGGVSLDGERYDPFFSDGRAQVDYVLGEFYWRVQVGEQVATDDYVRPGWMLSREANAQEVSWTRSALLSPKEIEAAFGVSAPRKPWPPLPHQPSPYRGALSAGWKIALGAFVLLLLLTMMFSGGGTLLRQTLPVTLDGRDNSATFGPFTLTRPYQLVRISAEVPTLDNAWVDLDYTLVNRANQETYAAYGIAERYSGRDSDGDWTEGSRRSTVKVAAIPAGTYDLVVDYSGSRWTGGSGSRYFEPTPIASPSKDPAGGSDPVDFSTDQVSGATVRPPADTLSIEVGQGFVFPSNFVLALLLLLLPLFWFFTRHLKFEKARQAESDVGPSGVAAMFESSDDDGEDD